MKPDREKKGYWSQINKKMELSPPEKLSCTLCNKEIQPSSFPQLRYSVGIICKECSDKKWKDKPWMSKK
jgi:hypothetical protein